MRIPIDEIKIDMSFVKNIKNNSVNQSMVKAIIDFAKRVGMTTCIEGIENEELEKYLRDYDATWFQGYHYSKPIAIEHAEQILMDNITDNKGC